MDKVSRPIIQGHNDSSFGIPTSCRQRPSGPATDRIMRLTSLFLAALLTACATADFTPRGETQASYAAQYAYFAEFCALSQIKKRPGFGADIRGEIGGHSVFYLNGACRERRTDYPVLRLCNGSDDEDGVGLSMNEHFRNAKWVATPGHDFFFNGNLAPNAPVTRATYQDVQRQAKRLNIYGGVVFHNKVFHDMPPGWTREDWKYEMSIATDYAISLGRGRYCARVPVDRAAMVRMIDFLNQQNAPYRAGAVFRWSVFQDNCIHLAHNALTVAGLWPEWRTNRFLLWAILDFPVPKNEFVNLMRRANDLPPDPGAVYDDAWARRDLIASDTLPARPGALAEARPPQQPNEVYETKLKLVFYDEPLFGPYQGWFDTIFSDPSYTDPRANRAHFAALARQNLAARKPLAWWLDRNPYRRDPRGFQQVYDRYYALMDNLANGR